MSDNETETEYVTRKFVAWTPEQLKHAKRAIQDFFQSAVPRESLQSVLPILKAITLHQSTVIATLGTKVSDANFTVLLKELQAILATLGIVKGKSSGESRTHPTMTNEKATVQPPTSAEGGSPEQGEAREEGRMSIQDIEGLSFLDTNVVHRDYQTLLRMGCDIEQKFRDLQTVHAVLLEKYSQVCSQAAKLSAERAALDVERNAFSKEISDLIKESAELKGQIAASRTPRDHKSDGGPRVRTIEGPVSATSNPMVNLSASSQAEEKEAQILGVLKETIGEIAAGGALKSAKEVQAAIFGEALNLTFDLDRNPSRRIRDVINNGGSSLFTTQAKILVHSEAANNRVPFVTLRRFFERTNCDRNSAIAEFSKDESFKLGFSHVCAILLADNHCRQIPKLAESEFQKYFDIFYRTLSTPVSQQVYEVAVNTLEKKFTPRLSQGKGVTSPEKSQPEFSGVQTSPSTPPTKESPRCFHCQKLGHIAKHCRSRLNGDQRVPPPPGVDGSGVVRSQPRAAPVAPAAPPASSSPVVSLTTEQQRSIAEAEYNLTLRRLGL